MESTSPGNSCATSDHDQGATREEKSRKEELPAMSQSYQPVSFTCRLVEVLFEQIEKDQAQLDAGLQAWENSITRREQTMYKRESVSRLETLRAVLQRLDISQAAEAKNIIYEEFEKPMLAKLSHLVSATALPVPITPAKPTGQNPGTPITATSRRPQPVLVPRPTPPPRVPRPSPIKRPIANLPPPSSQLGKRTKSNLYPTRERASPHLHRTPKIPARMAASSTSAQANLELKKSSDMTGTTSKAQVDLEESREASSYLLGKIDRMLERLQARNM